MACLISILDLYALWRVKNFLVYFRSHKLNNQILYNKMYLIKCFWFLRGSYLNLFFFKCSVIWPDSGRIIQTFHIYLNFSLKLKFGNSNFCNQNYVSIISSLREHNHKLYFGSRGILQLFILFNNWYFN